MVVIAVGVTPNIGLVESTPIAVKKGIIVDDYMQTNIKNVFAAGDCCEARDLLSGTNRNVALWPLAVRQGRIAGYNMAGVDRQYDGSLQMNAIELCGIPTVSVGETRSIEKGDRVLEQFDENRRIYKKVILRGNRIVGAIFVGEIGRAGIYTGLIKDEAEVTAFEDSLLGEDFGLISLPKQYRKHLVSGEVAMI
jgi:NAD(P)H-nitrite reductase large subunit